MTDDEVGRGLGGRTFENGIDGDPEGGDGGRSTEGIEVVCEGIERGTFGDVGLGAIGLTSAFPVSAFDVDAFWTGIMGVVGVTGA